MLYSTVYGLVFQPAKGDSMILNLTQHPATDVQRVLGVVDMDGDDLIALRRALTFESCPSRENIIARATRIVYLACANRMVMERGEQPRAAMIGGAGYLMSALEARLSARGIEPLHAFTLRDVVETTGPDGAVTKTAIFRHAGWVRTGK